MNGRMRIVPATIDASRPSPARPSVRHAPQATSQLMPSATATHAARQSVNETLNRSGRSGGGRSSGVRGWLVATEIALSVILLAGAGLTIRSLTQLYARLVA